MKLFYSAMLLGSIIGTTTLTSCANKNTHNVALETALYNNSKLYPEVYIPADIKHNIEVEMDEEYQIPSSFNNITGNIGINPLPPTLPTNHN